MNEEPQTIKDWSAGKIPVMFAHPASAGHGLTLQDGGNILTVFRHECNLEAYQEIIERSARSANCRPATDSRC